MSVEFYLMQIWGRDLDLDGKDLNGLSDPYFVIRIRSDEGLGKSERKVEWFEKEDGVMDKACDIGGNISSHVSSGNTSFLALGVVAAAFGVGVAVHHPTKTHPFIEGWKEVYTSGFVEKTLNPDWGLMCFPKIDGKEDVLFEVYDWDRFGKSDFVGQALISASSFLNAHSSVYIPLKNHKGVNSGSVYVQIVADSAELSTTPVHQHPLHLVPSVYKLDKGRFICNYCRFAVSGPAYTCADCKFDLHIECEKKCYKYPKFLTVKDHQHPLALRPDVYDGRFKCDRCKKLGKGAAYHCDTCKFDIHVTCVNL